MHDKKSILYELFIILFGVVSATTIVLICLITYDRAPIVCFSTATSECVSVSDPSYDCDNLPARYRVSWVK